MSLLRPHVVERGPGDWLIKCQLCPKRSRCYRRGRSAREVKAWWPEHEQSDLHQKLLAYAYAPETPKEAAERLLMGRIFGTTRAVADQVKGGSA